jgi:ATP-dependent RNA helicase RhlE
MEIKKSNNFRNRSNNIQRNSPNRVTPNKSSSVLDANLFIKKAKPIEEQNYLPTRSIEELPVDSIIIDNLKEKGFQLPTEIQDRTIEAILGGNDVMGLAQTGTGKTAAYLTPIIHQLLSTQPAFQVLIVAPTRELAVQIEDEFKSISKNTKQFSICLIGGTNVQRDILKLHRNYHFVIGTPGRILDLNNQGALNLGKFNTLILDEFDRLLDMGFSRDINRMIDKMHRRQQTILFSATEDKSQRELLSRLLSEPVEIRVSNGKVSADHIDQEVIYVKEGEKKMDILVNMIRDKSFEKVLVFAETKRWVSKVTKQLRSAGIMADEIHGNKSQNYRLNVLDSFKNHKIKVLVATDIAARGLDISNVSHVINFHQPKDIDSYIHRIGRTGRAGQSGKAFTFVN